MRFGYYCSTFLLAAIQRLGTLFLVEGVSNQTTTFIERHTTKSHVVCSSLHLVNAQNFIQTDRDLENFETQCSKCKCDPTCVFPTFGLLPSILYNLIRQKDLQL